MTIALLILLATLLVAGYGSWALFRHAASIHSMESRNIRFGTITEAWAQAEIELEGRGVKRVTVTRDEDTGCFDLEIVRRKP